MSRTYNLSNYECVVRLSIQIVSLAPDLPFIFSLMTTGLGSDREPPLRRSDIGRKDFLLCLAPYKKIWDYGALTAAACMVGVQTGSLHARAPSHVGDVQIQELSIRYFKFPGSVIWTKY